MIFLITGVIVAVLCIGLLTVASIFIRLDEAACIECGSHLPIVHPLDLLDDTAGNWACPRCGTQFNSHGKMVVKLSN